VKPIYRYVFVQFTLMYDSSCQPCSQNQKTVEH